MLETSGPYGNAGCIAARSPPRWEAGSKATGHVVRRSPLNVSEATIHVVTLELSSVSTRAVGHVAASEPTSAGRQVSVMRDTWWHVAARLVLCLDLKLICKVPDV
jgi:hypothetical protein